MAIKVLPQAQKTDAYQRNGNLILDNKAGAPTASPVSKSRQTMCAVPTVPQPPRSKMNISSISWRVGFPVHRRNE